MSWPGFRHGFMAGQSAALCLVRKWWRPATCIGIAGGAIVNLIIIPIGTWTPVNLTEAAAYVAAATTAFAVREWGKIKGSVE